MKKTSRIALASTATIVLFLAGAAMGNGHQSAGLDQLSGQMPLYFIENQGQMPDNVNYYIQGYDKTLYFTSRGVTYSLLGNVNDHRVSQSWVVKLDFLGADPRVKPIGEDRQEAIFSYFIGQPESWHTGLPTFGRIVYRNLWPGIDLVYSGTINMMKYQFVVRPGADPSQIRLAWRGATGVTVEPDGRMAINTPNGGFEDAAPYGYQTVDGVPVEVSMAFDLRFRGPDAAFEFGFDLGAYDPTRELILDPASLIYCGYIGGSGADMGWAVEVDDNGCAYVTGETNSAPPSFPVTAGPNPVYLGGGDAFVAKVRSDGTGLVYCGYIGGFQWDVGYGIDVDDQGAAYVTGYTASPLFPVVACPFAYSGNGDAFIVKVMPDGSAFQYSGCIGGTLYDEGHDVAVDDNYAAYLTGRANSSITDGFPVLVGPDLTYNNNGDAFVCKIDPNCGGLVYCGYIGGDNSDEGNGIDVDKWGYAYITGSTASNELSFPVNTGPDLTHNGGFDAFAAEVQANGGGLVYCGYIGGQDTDLGHAIVVDPVTEHAYITGETYSDHAAEAFPVYVGPDLTYNGSTDAFVAKVVSLGQSLLYCGYIGGQDKDYGFGIGIDVGGRAWVSGNTWTPEGAGFPVVAGPDLTFNGQVDAFISRVSKDGTGLELCGYIGGDWVDWAAGAAVDVRGNAYVTGEVTSLETTFPVLIGPDLTFNGNQDAFVAKIDCCVMRGDADGSGAIDVGDLTYMVAFLFIGGPFPPCYAEADTDSNGSVDVGDITYMVAFLFMAGPAPVPCP
ncbi:MAG: SBBP repeat-containing protein [bacterium]